MTKKLDSSGKSGRTNIVEQQDIQLDFVNVTDAKVKILSNADHTAVFSCNIMNFSKNYGMMFNETSKYIITFADGTTQEYVMFGDRLQYSEESQMLVGSAQMDKYARSASLMPLVISGVQDADSIVNIRITNISIWIYGVNNNRILKRGCELEVYKK